MIVKPYVQDVSKMVFTTYSLKQTIRLWFMFIGELSIFGILGAFIVGAILFAYWLYGSPMVVRHGASLYLGMETFLLFSISPFVFHKIILKNQNRKPFLKPNSV